MKIVFPSLNSSLLDYYKLLDYVVKISLSKNAKKKINYFDTLSIKKICSDIQVKNIVKIFLMKLLDV